MARFEIGMLQQHGETPRDDQARAQLADALPDEAQVGEPDADGAFDVLLEAGDLDSALTVVWDAVAASGTDDHLVFLEHPELPEHWRSKSGRRGNLPGSLS